KNNKNNNSSSSNNNNKNHNRTLRLHRMEKNLPTNEESYGTLTQPKGIYNGLNGQEYRYGKSYDNNNNNDIISNSLCTSAKYSPSVRSAQSELCLNLGTASNASKVIATRIANNASNISYNFNNTNSNTAETS
ncbi:unnamed protein product, partial [Sphagnum jensenii]